MRTLSAKSMNETQASEAFLLEELSCARVSRSGKIEQPGLRGLLGRPGLLPKSPYSTSHDDAGPGFLASPRLFNASSEERTHCLSHVRERKEKHNALQHLQGLCEAVRKRLRLCRLFLCLQAARISGFGGCVSANPGAKNVLAKALASASSD